ncbi:MAG: hypothetical protein PHT59_00525, partial [Candidatus Omnitrophica bacterium]|nr:hypothetical protein [Candidatus Omnitrophota bacterium]
MTKTANLENVRCDLCDSPEFKILFLKNDATRILQCCGCGLVFIFPQTVGSQTLAAHYQNDRTLDARRGQKIRRLRSPLSRLVLESCHGYPASRPRNSFEKFLARILKPFVATNIV